MTLATFDAAQITIRPWEQPVTARPTFDPRSPYVEKFWLGIIGPSACWLLRRIAAGFDASPEGFTMPLGETARALGLGDRGGRNSAFFRTLNRMVQFEVARPAGPDRLEVMRRLPLLTRRQASRLPEALQEAHERWRLDQLARREAAGGQPRPGRPHPGQPYPGQHGAEPEPAAGPPR